MICIHFQNRNLNLNKHGNVYFGCFLSAKLKEDKSWDQNSPKSQHWPVHENKFFTCGVSLKLKGITLMKDLTSLYILTPPHPQEYAHKMNAISKWGVLSLTFDCDCEWEAKCPPVVLWPLWLLCWLGSGKCRLCDAVVSIMEERQPPPSGCYVGQRRLSVDGRDWWRAPGRASECLPHSGATRAAPPVLVLRPPSWAAAPGAL